MITDWRRFMRWVAASVLILILCFAGIWTYRRIERDRAATSGAIQSSDLMTPSQQAEWDRRRAGNQTAEPAQQSTGETTPDTLVSGSEPTVLSQPESAMYSGRGRFQWYRQANLTWRLDTESGASCIVYATLEEWNKPLVKSHGCSHSATRP